MKKFELAYPGERWITVQNTEGKYAVSDQGRTASFHRPVPIILKPHPCRNGYLKVMFYFEGKGITVMPHRLVALHFIDKIEGKTEVNHINGNKTDNRAVNLEWCTRGENCRHAVKAGLHRGFLKGHTVINRPKGSAVHTSVLSEDQVKAIRLDRSEGMTFKGLEQKYQLKGSTIRSAIYCWKHI